MNENDLLSLVKVLARRKGINPQDYFQTLKQANRKRWGNSSLIRKDGTGIDLVFQEFQLMYPEKFECLDDFVEALADRLGRKQNLYDKYDREQIANYIQNEDDILIDLACARKPRLDKIGRAVFEDEGLIEKGRKVRLSKKAIKKILEMSLGD